MSKYTDNKGEWFDMWLMDKRSIIAVMYSNLNADLEAGYNPLGNSITKQRATIDAYINEVDTHLDSFYHMTEEETDRWCFYDMKKRGAIE